MLESLFNKVATEKTCNFIKKTLQQRYFPVDFVKIFKGSVLQNICKRLLIWLPACNFVRKETPVQIFSCEICEIFKNAFFTEHHRTTAFFFLFFFVLFEGVFPKFEIDITLRETISGCCLQIYETSQNRSSRSQMFFKIDVLKNFPNFTGKHQCWSCRPQGLKKRLQHRCFPVKFARFLRTTFLQNSSGGCFWQKLI